MIAGVAAGLADYFNVDATIIRILFLLALFFQGGGLLIYIILWIAIPARKEAVEPGPAGEPVPVTPGTRDYDKKTQDRSSVIIGWILVGLGIWFLMDEFMYPFMWDFFRWFDFSKIWPVVLIIVGVVIVASSASSRGKEGMEPGKKAEEEGGKVSERKEGE